MMSNSFFIVLFAPHDVKCPGTTKFDPIIWHIFGVMMSENMKMKPAKPRKGKNSKTYAKITPHANFH